MRSKNEFPHPIRPVTTMVIAILAGILALGHIASADTFTSATPTGTPINFSINFVNVGNAGNTAYTNTNSTLNGKGAVTYNYRMGTTEVTMAQFYAMQEMLGNPGSTATTPVQGWSGSQILMYTNWINSGCSTDSNSLINGGVYNFASDWTTINPWPEADQWVNGDGTKNIWRNKNAKYFLPTVDEWVKAAMYDGTGGYYAYPTSSNDVPLAVGVGSAGTNSANYDNKAAASIDVGSFPNTQSSYGCLDMAGNAWEVLDTSTSSSIGFSRIGGGFQHGAYWLNNYLAISNADIGGEAGISFRIAATPIPEPAIMMTLLTGLAVCLTRRQK